MSAPVTARDVFVQALADVQLTGEHTRDLVEALHKMIEPAHSAAELRTLTLTASRPISDGAAKHTAKSFTVVNPYGFNLELGIGGISATNIASYTVPATSVVTLPITAENLEVGADATALATGDAFVFVFLYDAPQPFFFGEWTA